MAAVTELAATVGTRAACLALWVPRGSYYRDRRSAPSRIRTAPRPSSVRALAAAERETILAYLHHERSQDRSPAAVYSTLLDEGQYHCSTGAFDERNLKYDKKPSPCCFQRFTSR